MPSAAETLKRKLSALSGATSVKEPEDSGAFRLPTGGISVTGGAPLSTRTTTPERVEPGPGGILETFGIKRERPTAAEFFPQELGKQAGGIARQILVRSPLTVALGVSKTADQLREKLANLAGAKPSSSGVTPTLERLGAPRSEFGKVLVGEPVRGPKEEFESLLSGFVGEEKGKAITEKLGPVAPALGFLLAATDISPIPKKSVAQAFLKSTGQKQIKTIGKKLFEIGSFGENALARKLKQPDRFDPKELPTTLENIVGAFKAGDDAFRKDNVIWLAKEKSGELRAVVTRLNKAGNEEVINAFKIGRDPETFIENLRKFGVPERTRTANVGLEDQGFIRLAYGDTPTIPKTEGQIKLPIQDRKIIDISPRQAAILPKKITPAFRLDKFNISDESKAFVQRTADEADQFASQRRGIITDEMAERLADDIIPPRTLAPGATLNKEEKVAFGRMTASLVEEVTELSKQIQTPQGSNLLNKAKLNQKLMAASHALASFSGAQSEAGRSLQSWKTINNAIASEDARLLQQASKIGENVDIEEVARRLLEFGDDTIAKYNFVKSLSKPNFADYITWYWYTSLLSGPRTHIRNLVGNTSNFVFTQLARPFAIIPDIVRSKVTGTPREVFAGEVPASAAGSWHGLKDGMRKALFAFNNGYSLEDLGALDIRPKQVFGGKLLPNIITRGLESADQFFSAVFGNAELYSQAYARAAKKGLKGTKLADEVARLIAEPPADLIEQVAKEAKRGVFREPPGKISSAFLKAKSDFKVTIAGKERTIWNPAKFVIPFIQTPGNIIRVSMEASPVGFLTAITKDTTRAKSQAAGRALLGTLTLTPLAMYAAEGKISGSGPKDPQLRELLYRSGWRPNSIKIGNNWINYSNFQPIALPLSLIANAFEAWHYNGKEISFTGIAAKAGNSFLDQSYLRGLSSVLNALEDPERYLSRFAEQTAASLRPLSGLLTNIQQSIDPALRQPKSVLEALKARTPGLSEQVRPRLDIFGRPIEQPGGTGLLGSFGRGILPFMPSPETGDKVVQQLLQNEIQIGYPSRTITKKGERIELTPDQYNEYLQMSGKRIYSRLQKAMIKASWERKNIENKEKLVKKIVDDERERARKKLFKTGGGLRLP